MPRAKKKVVEEITEKPSETKEQILMRLGTKRVNKAVKSISVIGNLVTYKPTDQDIDAIMEALGSACAAVENRLRAVKRTSIAFTLRTVPPTH